MGNHFSKGTKNMDAETVLDGTKPMKEKILVTGATGYVGGRLVARLLEAGYSVVATGRSLSKLQNRPWASHPKIELRKADMFHAESLQATVKGCHIAFYLIHSMNAQHKDFAAADHEAASHFIQAAEAEGLQRIIYLGGLGDHEDNLSKHLRSRQEVERVLSQSSIPLTVFRAAIIIGSGSASFEILRYLVDRLPVMVTPRWVRTPCQPIAIANVLEYLVRCLDVPETIGETFDIGGPGIITYHDLFQIYAKAAKLKKRWCFPVPVLTPHLSSYWIHLVTPVPFYLARPLTEGLKNTVVCQDQRILQLIPQTLLSYPQAIQRAIDRLHEHCVETHWTDAGKVAPVEWSLADEPHWAGGTFYQDRRSVIIQAQIEDVWQSVVRIGGRTGWYYGNWLWKLRGFLDRIIGGVGLGRGRRDSQDLRVGDALDWWRAKLVEKHHRLLLVAEMKVPGQAVLDFRLKRLDAHNVELQQAAFFIPDGLAGILYWYSVVPFHNLVFNGMLRGISDTTRTSLRCSVQTPVVIRDYKQEFEAEMVNLSKRSCQILSQSKIPHAPTLHLILTEHQNLTAQVAWVRHTKKLEGNYQVFQFEHPSEAFQSWINKTLLEQKGKFSPKNASLPS